MIKRNSAICNKSGDHIESKHRHDFVWCSCKSVAVDGGKDYLKRVGNYEDWKDTSVVEENAAT